MVAAVEQLQFGLRVACHHLAPVQHLVTFGDDGKLRRGRLLVMHVQSAQLVHKFGREVKVLIGCMELRLLADVLGQVARRVHSRVEQHARAVHLLCHPAGVITAQRRTHHRHALRWPAGHASTNHVHGSARRRQQLRAPELHAGVVLLHIGGHQPCLGRLRRRAKAMQVKQVRGVEHRVGQALGHGMAGVCKEKMQSGIVHPCCSAAIAPR